MLRRHDLNWKKKKHEVSIFVLLLILVGFAPSAMAQESVPGEFLIKFRGGISSGTIQSKIQSKAMFKSGIPALGIYHIQQKAGVQGDMDLESLKNDPDVLYVEPNYILKKQDDAGENFEKMTYEQILEDINIKRQASGEGALDVGSAGYTQTLADVHAEEAWAQSLPYNVNNRPIVAVIDTGLDSTHRVFTQSSAIWVNTGEIPGNGIDDDYNGYVDDVSGWNFISNTANYYDDQNHGTHVAGIVLGATQDIFPNPVATSKIRIMPLKFLNSSGSGTTANAIRAMYYAVNNGAKVINNSWGGSAYSVALHDAMTYAYNNEVLVVSAAGNNARDNDSSNMYPANYDVPSNLSVAATTDYDYLASFSNYGANKVHLGSPGVYVVSTYPGGNSFGYMSGTSMAAPFAAGLAALAFREAPDLTGYQMKNLLTGQSTTAPQLSGKVKNSGRLDALAIIDEAIVQSGTAANQPLYTAVYSQEESRSIASDGSGAAGGAGCGLVKVLVDQGTSALNHPKKISITLGLLLIPLLIWFAFSQMNPASRRRYERYKLESSVSLKVGGREIQGLMKTISLGGMSFSADDILERGGIVKIQIQSPEGDGLFEVEGQIVWSDQNNSYGLKFMEAEESLLQSISNWTKGAVRSN